MTNLYLDVAQIKAPELDINGMTNIPDVINMIIDTIDDGSPSDLDSAKDYVGQLGDYLKVRDQNVLQMIATGNKILDKLEQNDRGNV